MSVSSRLVLFSCLLPALIGSSCKPRFAYKPADKVLAQAKIAEWNQVHPDQPVTIVDWPALKAQCQHVQGPTLLLVMASYCHGVDVALSDIARVPDNSPKKPAAVIWVSNDPYNAVDKFLDKVKAHGFKGGLDILDNDVFGRYKDQRERNKQLLKAICTDHCGGVIYQSGLMVIELDQEGHLIQAGNMVSQVLGTDSIH